MRIVFMGTPDFSVPCLERLIADKHEIVGVFCREDKAVGRKQILTAPPVKVCAQQHGIPVFQPKKVKNNPQALKQLQLWAPELVVVVAYGRLLPPEILNLPKYGCVNVHASLLPRHRGASPIQWAIVCGDSQTGVTTMQMDEGMDTGAILLQQKTNISADETGESLFLRLSQMGAELLSKTVTALAAGTLKATPQPQAGVTHAPIITKEMGVLNFNQTAAQLDCLIRGFTPWPATFFYANGRRFKVLKAAPAAVSLLGGPGTACFKNGHFYICCAQNTVLEVLELCPEGSKKMAAAAFINGRFLSEHTVLSGAGAAQEENA